MPPSWLSLGKRHQPTSLLRALAAAALATGMLTSLAYAQFSSVPAPAAAAPPEPIYWKQNLFLIPYQWSSAADPGAAQAVWLLMSKDQGVTWQKISEAKPQVKAFNYHAEGDGEYWFAIRTLDRNGQLQPQGPYQPELRVIVDTTMPRIESLAAQYRSDGALQIQWRGSDLNLDSGSWKFEVQLTATGTWQPLPLAGLASTPISLPNAQSALGVSDGQTAWQPPPGSQPRVLRATVYDRAGNSAAYGAAITGAPLTTAMTNSASVASNVTAPVNPASASAPQGWVSASDVPSAAPQSAAPTASQPWPAGAVASAPFRLSAGPAPAPGDQVTSYGNPPGVGTPLATDTSTANAITPPSDQAAFGYAAAQRSTVNARASAASDQAAASRVVRSADFGELAAGPDPVTPAGPSFAPLEPYREAVEPFRRASLNRLPPVDDAPTTPISAEPSDIAAPPQMQPAPRPPDGIEPKRVGSRTFALEFELEEFGRAGIAKVELWGTRDGGQTWRSYATDDDHRSPVVVTVDGAGLYGFRIVVESAGSGVPDPPRGGDAPELWVDVDLNQPVAELTAIRPGAGNLADHLILQWRADDDNLEPRPIALFYSSRPAGPWSVIATNLENTGEYAWQVQRHVPERFYLRLEARDTAGNLAAFQTREPVIVSSPPPAGRLLSPVPVGMRDR